MKWHLEVFDYLQQGNYSAVSLFYQELIETEPETILHYYLLGLAYLLEGKEAEAESIWLSILTEVEETSEFIEVLEEEATRQEEQGNLGVGLLIREYLQETNPNLINNQLKIVLLSLQLNNLNLTPLITSFQEAVTDVSVEPDLLLEVLTTVLEYPLSETIELVKLALPYIKRAEFLEVVEKLIPKIEPHYPLYCIDLIELTLTLKPDHLYLLNRLAECYCTIQEYTKADQTITKLISYCSTTDLKLYGTSLYLYSLLKQGKWLEIESTIENYKTLLQQFTQEPPEILENLTRELLPLTTFPLFYIQDNPRETRSYQNLLSAIFQNNLRNYAGLPKKPHFPLRKPSKSLKIGYLASSLKRHSVGWLCRWLFEYHNKENFTIYLYLVNQVEDDITLHWFSKNAHQVYNFEENPFIISQQILSDQIDILIDLDSLTKPVNCAVMALKPAPIQITWLGLDATGIPNVDYFIVDPYVVPENAQEYYIEKLWTLPETYLAVSGFEVGVPTLTRKELNIPNEAVIYLTSQTAYKRHPENIRLQLQILKSVNNSYLLIKGGANLQAIETLFNQLAKEENIEAERLRYLSKDPTEEIYRANLNIADIVLDTYPYNGATTTLEVLWMGIPLVTLVGEQFAARNSYTFMLNAGITEGIAFNEKEYLEWGIKLGKDEKLRASIHWKLIKNRRSAPVWNAKKFTQEMENAYLKMWHNL